MLALGDERNCSEAAKLIPSSLKTRGYWSGGSSAYIHSFKIPTYSARPKAGKHSGRKARYQRFAAKHRRVARYTDWMRREPSGTKENAVKEQ